MQIYLQQVVSAKENFSNKSINEGLIIYVSPELKDRDEDIQKHIRNILKALFFENRTLSLKEEKYSALIVHENLNEKNENFEEKENIYKKFCNFFCANKKAEIIEFGEKKELLINAEGPINYVFEN